MKQTKLKVQTKNGGYPIIIGTNLSRKLSKIFISNQINFNKCFLLIDKKINKKTVKELVKSIKKKKIVLEFNPSEKNKNIFSVIKILNVLQKTLLVLQVQLLLLLLLCKAYKS